MIDTLTHVATVVVILQFLHSTLIYVATMVVYCRLYITFMDVATVVAGTTAVTALHETHVIKYLGVLHYTCDRRL
jgi:hypothetical protein